MVTMLSQLTADSWPIPLAGPTVTSVDRPRTGYAMLRETAWSVAGDGVTPQRTVGTERSVSGYTPGTEPMTARDSTKK
jgi:hypothetical protein